MLLQSLAALEYFDQEAFLAKDVDVLLMREQYAGGKKEVRGGGEGKRRGRSKASDDRGRDTTVKCPSGVPTRGKNGGGGEGRKGDRGPSSRTVRGSRQWSGPCGRASRGAGDEWGVGWSTGGSPSEGGADPREGAPQGRRGWSTSGGRLSIGGNPRSWAGGVHQAPAGHSEWLNNSRCDIDNNCVGAPKPRGHGPHAAYDRDDTHPAKGIIEGVRMKGRLQRVELNVSGLHLFRIVDGHSFDRLGIFSCKKNLEM